MGIKTLWIILQIEIILILTQIPQSQPIFIESFIFPQEFAYILSQPEELRNSFHKLEVT